MPIMTPPSTWPSAPDLVDDRARVVRARDLEHPHDAGVAVELHAHRVAAELRRRPGVHAELADAVLVVGLAGRPGACPSRVPSSSSPPCAVAASSAIATRLSGEPLTWAWPSASSMSSGEASIWSAASCRSCSAICFGGGDDGAAVVDERLRAGRAHVPRAGVGVLVDEREVLGLHAELVGRQHRQRHDRAGAALLRARDDHARAVAVELDVGARGHREASATSRRRRRSPRRRAAPARSRSSRRRWRCTRCRPISQVDLPLGPSSPVSMQFLRRNSTGSMPIAAATSSVCCSSAQQACGAVGARTEPDGWWFV